MATSYYNTNATFDINQFNTDFDEYLIKVNGEGEKQWEKTYGGVGVDKGEALVQTSDGGYALLGSSELLGNPMISLIKTKSNGELK